ncbi:hypothetical protein COCNU_scaffold036998G000020 [Cocos nucifera]|nr:hypothetical protein [Cocos nucifera]
MGALALRDGPRGSVVPVGRTYPIVFPDLDDFRHPLDKQNTLLLRAIPGLNELGKLY